MSGVLQRWVARLARIALIGLAAGALSTSLAAVKEPPPKVAINTSEGTIVVALQPDLAPITVANFLAYVRAGQYNGTLFHRVIKGFMIQGGGFDPSMHEKPTGQPIKNEATNGLKNQIGTIAMAREPAPDSATAEFFINVADNDFLDHLEVPPQGVDVTRHGQTRHVDPANADQVYGYAVFGRVIQGMDVVNKIVQVPTTSRGEYQDVPVKPVVIESVTIIS